MLNMFSEAMRSSYQGQDRSNIFVCALKQMTLAFWQGYNAKILFFFSPLLNTVLLLSQLATSRCSWTWLYIKAVSATTSAHAREVWCEPRWQGAPCSELPSLACAQRACESASPANGHLFHWGTRGKPKIVIFQQGVLICIYKAGKKTCFDSWPSEWRFSAASARRPLAGEEQGLVALCLPIRDNAWLPISAFSSALRWHL